VSESDRDAHRESSFEGDHTHSHRIESFVDLLIPFPVQSDLFVPPCSLFFVLLLLLLLLSTFRFGTQSLLSLFFVVAISSTIHTVIRSTEIKHVELKCARQDLSVASLETHRDTMHPRRMVFLSTMVRCTLRPAASLRSSAPEQLGSVPISELVPLLASSSSTTATPSTVTSTPSPFEPSLTHTHLLGREVASGFADILLLGCVQYLCLDVTGAGFIGAKDRRCWRARQDAS